MYLAVDITNMGWQDGLIFGDDMHVFIKIATTTDPREGTQN